MVTTAKRLLQYHATFNIALTLAEKAASDDSFDVLLFSSISIKSYIIYQIVPYTRNETKKMLTRSIIGTIKEAIR